jgi:hypothetical protein
MITIKCKGANQEIEKKEKKTKKVFVQARMMIVLFIWRLFSYSNEETCLLIMYATILLS